MKLWKEAFVTHTIDMHFGDVIGRIRPSLSTANKVRPPERLSTYIRSQGKSWDDIIESAGRIGGKDLGF
jgi:hypothetical protein